MTGTAGGRTLARARGLDRARILYGDLNLALDVAHDRSANLPRASARDLALARALDRDLDRALNLDLDRALDLARALHRDLVSALAHTRARDRHRALASAGAADHARPLTRARARVLARNRARANDRARATARALTRARDCALDLANYLEHHDASISRMRAGERRAEVRVAPVAGRLVTAATRVLPARDRVRYDEELRAELWEIARAGGGRRPQLTYAARQVMAAPRLRAGLRVPRRRGVVP